MGIGLEPFIQKINDEHTKLAGLGFQTEDPMALKKTPHEANQLSCRQSHLPCSNSNDVIFRMWRNEED